jgi:hypothetical protein
MPNLELRNQLNHLGIRFRLRKHEAPELSQGERSLLMKNHPPQIVFQRYFSILVGVEGKVMPIFHIGPPQFKARRRSLAGSAIPSVGKQDAADVQKQRRDRDRCFHLAYSNAAALPPAGPHDYQDYDNGALA